MNAFTYTTAQSATSAVELVGPRGRFIAGGIDLLGELKEDLIAPTTLVNVKKIPDTRGITPGRDQWVIGANVTLDEIATHPELGKTLRGLAEAAAEVGSPQMRHVATLGGNLAQHSRCWYYRHRDIHCLKRGGRQCFARDGLTKYHSLFTKSMCLSPCVSNLAMILTALGARAVVQRGRKPEVLPLAKLYDSAWSNAKVHHSLDHDDLILRIEVPVAPALRSTYLQVSEKAAFDWALVSCAAAGRVEAGKLRDARVVLGAVAPIPWQVEAAHKFLDGKEPTEAVANQAADIILRNATPQEHNAYKILIARTLIRRALLRLA